MAANTTTAPDRSTANFTGRAALVTGGTSGIGRAAVLSFARRGADVVFTGRRAAEGLAVAREASALGVKALFVQGDVTNPADIRKAVDTAAGLHGRLDFAFNNAGVEGVVGSPLVEQTEENYRQVFDINVRGVLLSMQHEIRAMLSPRSGKPGGSIVNNASIAGTIGFPGVSVYVASKHAVIGLTKTAALEYSKQGVRINTVSPAAIQTDMLDRFTGALGGPDMRTQFAAMHPIGRMGTPQEIADAAIWLCSDESSFVTGHDLRVDGGFTAQ